MGVCLTSLNAFMCSVDFEKAYDRVPHDVLRVVFQDYGVRGLLFIDHWVSVQLE